VLTIFLGVNRDGRDDAHVGRTARELEGGEALLSKVDERAVNISVTDDANLSNHVRGDLRHPLSSLRNPNKNHVWQPRATLTDPDGERRGDATLVALAAHVFQT
jgi:hypothetical protein